jgi:hypothetical protein
VTAPSETVCNEPGWGSERATQSFRARIITDFESSCGANAFRPEVVREEPLRAALQIGTDEACGGKQFFGAEVTIENQDEPAERLIIAIGASTLR